MSKPVTRAGWEAKLQQVQDDLELRDAALRAQEARYTALAAKADEVNRRMTAVEVRERRAAELEADFARFETAHRDARAAAAALADREARVAAAEAALAERRAELAADVAAFDARVAEAEAQLGAREARVAERAAENEAAAASAQQHADDKAAHAARVENAVAATRAAIHDERRVNDELLTKAKVREEELENREKQLKELQETEERGRRALKAQEDAFAARVVGAKQGMGEASRPVAAHLRAGSVAVVQLHSRIDVVDSLQ